MDTNVARRSVLVGGVAAAAVVAARPTIVSAEPEGVEEARLIASRAELEAVADAYVNALLAHDPSRASFAAGAVFSENDQILPLGEASWKTFMRFGRYRHYFADPQNGEVGLIANPYEVGGGCVFVLRLKVNAAKRITEAEQFVARDPSGAAAYEQLGAPDPVWLEPIPVAQRQAHEALRAVGFMYFEALQRNDGAGIYPFRDDCERIEHARPTWKQKREGYGHSDVATDFTTLSAKAQYEMGMMAFVAEIRDRRSLVVDVERGAVLASSYYDYDGALRKIDFRNSEQWTLPPYFRSSRSHHANEAFKIINGSFRYIEMTFIEVPYATRHAFAGPPMTVRLDYDTPLPLPTPIAVPSRPETHALTERLLDAMMRNCPCAVPLSPEVRYTENGVPLAPGKGLWQSLNGLRDYRVSLADPASGQGGWFGALDERTLFAMMALRYRLEKGLISQIEVIVARPQKPAVGQELATATFTMFTPPLEYDLDPAGFPRPAPALLASAPAGSEVLVQAAGMQEAVLSGAAASRFTARSNGHPLEVPVTLPAGVSARGHRVWLADSAQGLVLDLALRDNTGAVPGAPADRAAPWSDIHARLLKVEQGRPGYSEGLTVRVPFGQGSGWPA